MLFTRQNLTVLPCLLLSLISLESFAQVLDENAIIDSVFQSLESMDSTKDQIIELQAQANYQYDFAPFTKIFLDSALTLATDENLAEDEAKVLLDFMQYFLAQTQSDSTMWYYERAMRLPILDSKPFIRADFFGQKATMYKKQGNSKGAIEYFLRALAILEAPGYVAELQEEEILEVQRSLCVIHNNLANLYKEIKDFPSANRHYERAFDLLLRIDEKGLAGTVLMNKGSIYLERGIYDTAYTIQLEAKALKIDGEATLRSIAMSDLNLGNALKGLQRPKEAMQYMTQAISTLEDLQIPTSLIDALVSMGSLLIEEQDFKTGVAKCERGFNLAVESQLVEQQHRACACLYMGYKGLGNLVKALQNHERLKALTDSLRNNENTKFITQLEMQYAFDRQEEKRLIVDEASRVLQDEKNKRNQRVMLILTALLAVALLAGYLSYRNFQIKKKAEEVLAQKNHIISTALQEKELLLREIHHRVKNNLQVISSLLRLQSRYIEDDAALDAISAGRSRVQSMALLHENLYKDGNLTGIDMQKYFDKLIGGLFTTLNIADERISLIKEVAPIHLDVDSVIPIGLITNELITNALKHAFTEQETGVLTVKLFETQAKLHLEVSDNGKGMPADIFDRKNNSFGHKLITAFAAKLKADLTVSNDHGTTVRFIISEYKVAG